jgi:hypothetical protein
MNTSFSIEEAANLFKNKVIQSIQKLINNSGAKHKEKS